MSGYLGSFKTYEEWTAPRPEALAKPWPDLAEPERKVLDEWIASQFEQRNTMLIDQKIESTSVIARLSIHWHLTTTQRCH